MKDSGMSYGSLITPFMMNANQRLLIMMIFSIVHIAYMYMNICNKLMTMYNI